MEETALSSLRRRFDAEAEEEVRVVLGTRLGIAQAQAGRVEESRILCKELRARNEYIKSNLASIYLLALDGILCYYESGDRSSLDRVNRAFALSVSGNNKKVVADVGVWLILLSYNFDRLDLLRSAIRHALDNFALLEYSERARLLGLLGDLLQLTGFDSLTSSWYMVSRDAARTAKDGAAIAAIEYNRLAAGITRLRQDEILGESLEWAGTRSWAIEVQSIKSLHIGYRSDALLDLISLCDARQLHLQGDDARSATLLHGLVDRDASSLVGCSDACLRLEAAWYCVLANKPTNVALTLIDPVLNKPNLIGPHDVAVAFYLRELFSKLSLPCSKEAIDDALRVGLADLHQYRQQLKDIARTYVNLDPRQLNNSVADL